MNFTAFLDQIVSPFTEGNTLPHKHEIVSWCQEAFFERWGASAKIWQALQRWPGVNDPFIPVVKYEVLYHDSIQFKQCWSNVRNGGQFVLLKESRRNQKTLLQAAKLEILDFYWFQKKNSFLHALLQRQSGKRFFALFTRPFFVINVRFTLLRLLRPFFFLLVGEHKE